MELKSDDSEMLDDCTEVTEKVDRDHEAKSIYFNAAKLIRSELKELARLERKTL